MAIAHINLQIDIPIYYILVKKKGMPVKRKTNSDKEESVKNNPGCRNCPYYINKLVCPFRRKEAVKEHESHDSSTRQR